MSRRNWKKVRATSLRHALELCKDHAKDTRNFSVERIAEEMGEADHWTLYKWLQNGRMPAVQIPAYEAACGVDFVTRWLATRSGKLLIDVPTGRKLKATDVAELQNKLHAAVGELMQFYKGDSDAEQALAAITHSMESLAWHKGNVEQHDQPQLELGDSNDD